MLITEYIKLQHCLNCRAGALRGTPFVLQMTGETRACHGSSPAPSARGAILGPSRVLQAGHAWGSRLCLRHDPVSHNKYAFYSGIQKGDVLWCAGSL